MEVYLWKEEDINTCSSTYVNRICCSKYDISYPGTSGTASTVKLPYNTETGVKASTTGNITGIYDMSGGLWEYMAAYSGVGSSGLTAAELIAF